MVKQYRKKPVVIEALQFLDDVGRIEDLVGFITTQTVCISYKDPDNPKLLIDTLEGVHEASVGDYIIKGVNGEYYPCKPDVFEKTYEEV